MRRNAGGLGIQLLVPLAAFIAKKQGNSYSRFMPTPYAPDHFFSDNVEAIFTRDGQQQITGFIATKTRHPGASSEIKRTEKPLPALE